MEKADIQKSIAYFKSLIDQNGIIQFTKGYDKDYQYGYAIEDQARALILAISLNEVSLVRKFVTLIKESVIEGKGVGILRDKNGNLSGKTDGFNEASSEVLWSFCELKSSKFYKSYKFIDKVINVLKVGLLNSKHLRVLAYTLLGLSRIKDLESTDIIARFLVKKFIENKSGNWIWFEDKLTYANSLMPWSLIKAYQATGKKIFKEVAIKSYSFLYKNLKQDGTPIVIGNKGWWKKGEEMALFGQQPIDASYMSLCAIAFYDVLRKAIYLEDAMLFYSWFYGNNIKRKNLIREDGACYDGLYEDGVNINAGAESNICYLLASLEMKKTGMLK